MKIVIVIPARLASTRFPAKPLAPLIGADGQPKAECFIPGDIHMLPAGYAVWKSVIAPIIVPAEKPFEHAQ